MAVDKTDFVKLVRTVSVSAEDVEKADGGGEVERVLDGLKKLLDQEVTMDLLTETRAGKKLGKLSKHKDAKIAAAAGEVVQSWRKKLKERKEQGIQSKDSGKITRRESTGDVKMEFSELKKLGNPLRDKIRAGLASALKVDHEKFGGDPNRSAAEIEVAVFKQHPGLSQTYKTKVRSLMFNLKDVKNSGLRRRILQGELSGEVLVTLSSEELANEEKQSERKEIQQRKLEDCKRGQTTQATTDQFQCGRCKRRQCTYYQMQTRSADEPMTTFVTCTSCNNRWKFC